MTFIEARIEREKLLAMADWVESSGMVAENQARELHGESPAYGDGDFQRLAEGIRANADAILELSHNL